jgi:transposase
LSLFFEGLTQEQRDGIEYVAADGARWITRQVEKFCPNAKRCVDPFHVVGWATEALDNTRKRLSSDTKKNGSPS